MGAGDTIFGDHETLIKRLPDLLEKTNKTINEGRLTPIFISAIFHGYFIYLHPFRDGNGRLGRLLSNKILLQAGLPPLIIKKEDKADYINVMNKFKKENGSSNLVSYFYHTAIKQMESEIEEKQRLNEGNNFKDFN
jgi:Fic family protein